MSSKFNNRPTYSKELIFRIKAGNRWRFDTPEYKNIEKCSKETGRNVGELSWEQKGYIGYGYSVVERLPPLFPLVNIGYHSPAKKENKHIGHGLGHYKGGHLSFNVQAPHSARFFLVTMGLLSASHPWGEGV